MIAIDSLKKGTPAEMIKDLPQAKVHEPTKCVFGRFVQLAGSSRCVHGLGCGKTETVRDHLRKIRYASVNDNSSLFRRVVSLDKRLS